MGGKYIGNNKNMKIKKVLTIDIIFLIVQAITLVGFIFDKSYEYILGLVTTTTLYFIYVYLENKYHIYMNKFVRLCVIITLISNHLLGEKFELYKQPGLFDKALHVFGTYSFTLFVYLIIIQIIKISFTSKLSNFIFIVMLGITIGVSFEVLEFILDLTFNLKTPLQTNLMDTNLDIVSDIIGALLAALYNLYILKISHPPASLKLNSR